MSINHKEYIDRPDHVSATNYGLCAPPLHSIVLRYRSAVPSLFYVVKSSHRTQSNPVQPFKRRGIPQTKIMNHPDLTNPNPIPMNNPSSTAPLRSMRLNPPLSLAMIPLPRIPLPNCRRGGRSWPGQSMRRRRQNRMNQSWNQPGSFAVRLDFKTMFTNTGAL